MDKLYTAVLRNALCRITHSSFEKKKKKSMNLYRGVKEIYTQLQLGCKLPIIFIFS